MGIGSLTKREERLKKRSDDRKKLLRKSSVVGYKRPEGFGSFDDQPAAEQKEDKEQAPRLRLGNNLIGIHSSLPALDKIL